MYENTPVGEYLAEAKPTRKYMLNATIMHQAADASSATWLLFYSTRDLTMNAILAFVSSLNAFHPLLYRPTVRRQLRSVLVLNKLAKEAVHFPPIQKKHST